LLRSLTGLEVDTRAMRANLERSVGLIMAESVALALAAHLGREPAQAVLRSAIDTAVRSGRDLESVLSTLPPIVAHLGQHGLARAMDPLAWLGVAPDLTDSVLARYDAAAQRP
jgi:3-carboxy-cis,cis-muconate cycloisomerase